MCEMLDIINMTEIAEHCLLEYETLLHTSEMQGRNCIKHCNDFSFNDSEIDNLDTDTENGSNSSHYSNVSEKDSFENREHNASEEYSVTAGSKPLSIIFRRCNVQNEICTSSAVKEENKTETVKDSTSLYSESQDNSELFSIKLGNSEKENFSAIPDNIEIDNIEINDIPSVVNGSKNEQDDFSESASFLPNRETEQDDISSSIVSNTTTFISTSAPVPSTTTSNTMAVSLSVPTTNNFLYSKDTVISNTDKSCNFGIEELSIRKTENFKCDSKRSENQCCSDMINPFKVFFPSLSSKESSDGQCESQITYEENMDAFDTKETSEIKKQISCNVDLPSQCQNSTENSKLMDMLENGISIIKQETDGNIPEVISSKLSSSADKTEVIESSISREMLLPDIEQSIHDIECVSSLKIPSALSNSDSMLDSSSIRSYSSQCWMNDSKTEQSFLSENSCFDIISESLCKTISNTENPLVCDINTNDICDISDNLCIEDETANESSIFENTLCSTCSPLLFSSDDESTSINKELSETIKSALMPSPSYNTIMFDEKQKLSKLQGLLTGVPPPPSITIPQIYVTDFLRLLKENENLMSLGTTNNDQLTNIALGCREATTTEWPKIKFCRYPGVNYNHGVYSEEYERNCQKLQERFVGCETASSCTIWSTQDHNQSKKRVKSLNMVVSSGTRLNNVTRNKKTFSSASLAERKMTSILPHAAPERRTILVVPSKTDKLQAQKKTNLACEKKDAHLTRVNSSKRALFQSPTEEKKTPFMRSRFRNLSNQNEVLNLKRALFNDSGGTPDEHKNSSKKRCREEKNDNTTRKIPRRSLFVDASSASHSKEVASSSISSSSSSSLTSSSNSSKNKSSNPSNQEKTKSSQEISSIHRKKLLWAVAEALKQKGVGTAHPRYRICAKELVNKCYKYVEEIITQRQGSTSDRMLVLALKYVDDILKRFMKNC